MGDSLEGHGVFAIGYIVGGECSVLVCANDEICTVCREVEETLSHQDYDFSQLRKLAGGFAVVRVTGLQSAVLVLSSVPFLG